MSITLYIGPMGASKTTTLLADMERYSLAKKKCVCIKAWIDDRAGSEYISTHSGYKVKAKKFKYIKDSYKYVDDYDVVCIDEGQFFPDIVKGADTLAGKGKIVIISAIDSDHKRNPFGEICNLIPKCENVIKRKAVCMKCYSDASFTIRNGDDKSQIKVGGMDLYTPVCRKCYLS